MKVNLEEFRKRAEFIGEQKHPTLGLIIWNYSHKCQYARAWDEYTTMTRGLITDLEGNIVARPFKKFFNLGEGETEIPTDNPIISPKFDGSLGIQYYDGDEVRIATRGSFESDQAKFATAWMTGNLTPRFGSGRKRQDFLPGKTYLYEIIYPENRIVVDYKGKEMLVLLAVIDNETGKEEPYANEDEGARLDLPFAEHLTYENVEKTIGDISGDEEGYVLHWPHRGNLRMKVKGVEYVRLHRLLTQVSSKSIWEFLRDGKPLDELIERVPDEFYDWVKKTKENLESRYYEMLKSAREVITVAGLEVGNPDAPRAEWAKVIKMARRDVQPIAFALLSGKDPSQAIWRQLKPKYERPFKRDIDAT